MIARDSRFAKLRSPERHNKVLTPWGIEGLNSDSVFLKISPMSDTEPQSPDPQKPSTKTSTVPLKKETVRITLKARPEETGPVAPKGSTMPVPAKGETAPVAPTDATGPTQPVAPTPAPAPSSAPAPPPAPRPKVRPKVEEEPKPKVEEPAPEEGEREE